MARKLHWRIEFLEGNAFDNFATVDGIEYESHNSSVGGYVSERGSYQSTTFATQDQARRVALALRWNNQRYRLCRTYLLTPSP